MAAIEELTQQFETILLSVNRLAAQELFENALQHASPAECLDRIMTPALERIGQQWESGDVALSQVYMSGILCEEIIASLFPQSMPQPTTRPKIAIVTFEDYHMLGKRILRSLLAAKGIPVLDYGHGVQKDELVSMVARDTIQTLLISTLMFPSALRIELVRQELDQMGRNVNIIVGGAPFRLDDQLWKRVGADAMGRTASDAVSLIHQFEEKKP